MLLAKTSTPRPQTPTNPLKQLRFNSLARAVALACKETFLPPEKRNPTNPRTILTLQPF